MQAPAPQCVTMALGEILSIFRAALLSVIPHAEKVGVRWKEWEAYDGWDRIEEALFQSMVSECVEFIFGEGQVFPLPLINNVLSNPHSESLLFDEALGQRFRFLGLQHGIEPFDTASFITDEEVVIEKALAECRFAVLGNFRDGRESQVTCLGCVG